MTLPGQTFTSGVSNFVFGTNMGVDYSAQNVRNNSSIQNQIKLGGFTIMRCAIPAGSTNAYLDQTYNACVAMKCVMMPILIHDNPTWNSTLVTYYGSKCNLYEFANEPDLYPSGTDASGHAANSPQAYYYWWNLTVPTCRGINPSAAFIGPALGVFANLNSFVTPWLTSCHSAGGAVMPDGISFHVYPCTGTQSQSVCAAKAGNFASCYSQVDTLVTGIVGSSLPLCLTEWNIDANFDQINNPYITDSSFVQTWTHTALDSMASAGYAMANQYEAGSGAGGGKGNGILLANLVNTVSPFNVQVQWQPMVDKINQYLHANPSVPDNPYMVKIGTTSATGTFPSQAITDIKNLGATWLFCQCPWNLIDATGLTTQVAANYHWAFYDSAVSQCNAAKINIVLAIMFAPGQLQTNGLPTPSKTANFAAQIATRYNGSNTITGGGTGTVQGIYVGNEDYDTGGTGGEPTFLVSNLKATYPAVKAVNPAIKVIAGAKLQRNAAFYTSWFDTLLNTTTGAYIGGVFQADAITFHYHTCQPADPSGNSLSLDPTKDVTSSGITIPSWQHSWQLIDAKRKQYNNSVPVWADENGMNVNTNPAGPTRLPGSVISPAQRWTWTQYELDSARTSGVVQKFGIFTIAEYTGYPAPNYRDGQSIVQGTSGSPIYDDTYVGMQNYIAQYPQWYNSFPLVTKVRSSFITAKAKLASLGASKFVTKKHLVSTALNKFKNGSTLKFLTSKARSLFSIKFSPEEPEYARDTFPVVDGVDVFVGSDGKDSFTGIG